MKALGNFGDRGRVDLPVGRRDFDGVLLVLVAELAVAEEGEAPLLDPLSRELFDCNRPHLVE